MFPVAADQFTGGDIEEPDINFDGIPDLIISLGAQNGYGTVVYDGFVWNAKTKKFDWVDSFREIGNPEINASEENIIGNWSMLLLFALLFALLSVLVLERIDKDKR